MSEQMDFEKMIASVDELVVKLGDENLPLNESLELYKSGINLIEGARKMLLNAELQIKEIENPTQNQG